jgi:hypothetical protein
VPDDEVPHVRLIDRWRNPADWRAAEVNLLETVVARIDLELEALVELERLLGDEEDVAHAARELAARLRSARNSRIDRFAELHAAIREIELEVRV